MTRLEFAKGKTEVLKALKTFNRQATMNAERAKTLTRQTTYWVFWREGHLFGPGKFVGYQNMDFKRYDEALNGYFDGRPFDGHRTRQAIEKALHLSFAPDLSLSPHLKKWADRLFGTGALDDLDESKWRFNIVSQPGFRDEPRAGAAPTRSKKKYWFTMQYPPGPHQSLWVRTNKETEARDVKKGDYIAIYETGTHRHHPGRQAVVALAKVDKRLTSREIDVDEEGREWLKTAQVKLIAKDGECPFETVVPILKPGVNATTRQSLGSHIFNYGGRVVPIQREQFERFGDYFADYESQSEETDRAAFAAFDKDAEYEGQGFAASELRRAIESHAMKRAKAYLRQSGCSDIKDCSKSKPYDFRCMRNSTACFVEVKGTQSRGMNVLLTANEVTHMNSAGDAAVLFLVHSIDVRADKDGHPITSGGKTRILNPWRISKRSLEPLAYRYTLPPD